MIAHVQEQIINQLPREDISLASATHALASSHDCQSERPPIEGYGVGCNGGIVEHVRCYDGHAGVHVLDEGLGASVDGEKEVIR